ncbi:aminotransferase class V-fold PLP-dependent enzyme [Kutzneria sp. 744]|uniref:aminotransferase class V-fold PLP-dependent enzyme n=1 Tax=Kutzneria sp. (strain 744) TaxID=345341 RepID=UPI0003EEE09D|nr:aminotransferase class V-fold PLP-dependent enzyme [Kutzneria sp. 744]EWM18487.1 cysteine desulfurase [Kutzneria sp. 744]
MSLSPAAFRAHFPVLGTKVHLASCSLGARSVDVDAALEQMRADMSWDRFEDQLRQARHGFAALVGARPEQIAVVPNASVGAYQVASTMDFARRSKIVTTDLEFPSVAHVWLAQCPRGAEVVFSGEIDADTRLVSVPMTGYQYSERLPVADVVQRAHEAGAEVFVDAYQAVGTEPVDVDRLGCDYLVAGTMKYLLGLPGLAFLYARSPERTDRDPQLTGWFGRVDPFAFDPRRLDFASTATRFETGTPAVPAVYTANAGLRLVARADLTAVREHVLGLTDLAVERLTAMGRPVRALPRDRRGAHIGLVDADPVGLAKRLTEHDIAVSPRGDVVRLSFHHHSNSDDIDALCAALSRIERQNHVHG